MPLTPLTYQVICSHSLTNNEDEQIIIIPISEKEEAELDEGALHTKRDNFSFDIEGSNIICYGEIDFHSNSEDFKVLQNITIQGLKAYVPADYNYDEHCCYSPRKSYRYHDTFDFAKLAQYFHARLNKPQRCCIFKERYHVKKRVK